MMLQICSAGAKDSCIRRPITLLWWFQQSHPEETQDAAEVTVLRMVLGPRARLYSFHPLRQVPFMPSARLTRGLQSVVGSSSLADAVLRLTLP